MNIKQVKVVGGRPGVRDGIPVSTHQEVDIRVDEMIENFAHKKIIVTLIRSINTADVKKNRSDWIYESILG